MLSWDDFDREDLQDEFSNYAQARRANWVKSHGWAYTSDSDTVAIARAKAALDKLDMSLEAPELRAVRSRGNFDGFTEYRDIIRAICGLESGSHRLYNIHVEYSNFSAIRAVVSRIVSIFAAYFLSARTCSLATVSRNAILRTPLFAYDAELSVVRHRLRAAL